MVIGKLKECDQDHLLHVLQKYQNYFANDTLELGHSSTVEMNISLSSDKTVTHKPYKLSDSERKRVREKVKDLLGGGIIRESTSNFSSPVGIVKKKTGDFRLRIDYRKLNSITIKGRSITCHGRSSNPSS